MTRLNQLLSGLFALQVMVAAGIYFGSQPAPAEKLQTALLQAERSQVDHITVENGNGKQAVLTKVNGRWQLPEYYLLPAKQSKIEQVLANLASTKTGWPVTTTASSQDRFKVSENDFQSRITLAQGDKKLQQLYLGSSPGFRQLHARRGEEEEVYSVKLHAHDFPVDADKWLDRTLIQAKGDITVLEGPDFVLNKQDGEWKLAEAEGELVTEKLDELVNTLTSINVLAAEDKAIGESDYSLIVKTADKGYTYRFFSEDNNHYVSRGDYTQVFKVSKLDYNKITGQTATQLVRQAEQKEDPARVDNKQEADTEQSG